MKTTAEFAAELIRRIREGTAPWQMPMRAGAITVPTNGITKRQYTAGNVIRLMMTEASDQRWATYRQWKSIDGQVRRGEKGTIIVRPVVFRKWDDELGEETERISWRYYFVFHAGQVDGIGGTFDVPDWRPDGQVERIVEGLGVEYVVGGMPGYGLSGDRIRMPAPGFFRDRDAWANTMLHEAAHATGHPSRLKRDTLIVSVGEFGSVDYAREELRAEIGAMMACVRLGAPFNPMEDSAKYIGSWCKMLSDTPTEIVDACNDAQKIADFLIAAEAVPAASEESAA